MSKYKSKESLLQDIIAEKAKLDILLQKVPFNQILKPGVCEEWSVKDILAHLTEWQILFFNWFEVGLSGVMPNLPVKGYNWAQIPLLNEAIYKKHKDTDLRTIQITFQQSHNTMIEFIEERTEKELLESGHYPWTKKNPLISYLAPNTSSHYRWARRLINKWLKNKS